MKHWKTTLVGCLAAILVAVKPLLDQTGYHFDTKTICEMIFAASLAVLGVLSRDYNSPTEEKTNE